MMNQFDKGLMPAGTAIAERREIPRMLDALLERLSGLEEDVEELAVAVSPVLSPFVPQEGRKEVTVPLGAPLAVNLDMVNAKLAQIHWAIRDLTSRVQL